MIESFYIKKADNGFILDYWTGKKGKKYHQRIFFTWKSLCKWLCKRKKQ